VLLEHIVVVSIEVLPVPIVFLVLQQHWAAVPVAETTAPLTIMAVVAEQVVAPAAPILEAAVVLFISPEVYNRATAVAATAAATVVAVAVVEDSGAELAMDIALVVIPDAMEAAMGAYPRVLVAMVEKDLPCNLLMVPAIAVLKCIVLLDTPILVQPAVAEVVVVAAAITVDVMAVVVVMDRAILAVVQADQELPTLVAAEVAVVDLTVPVAVPVAAAWL
jgi:hypothetical protein